MDTTRDELRRICAIHDRHVDRLLAIPGCTATAVGYKQRGGAPTTIPAIIVYVEKKELAPALGQRISETIQGVPTDVVERSFDHRPIATDPHARFAQVFSGIAITPYETPHGYGTLGCIIRTSGRLHSAPVIHPGNYVLTNQHVIAAANPVVGGDPSIIQPDDPAATHVRPVPPAYLCADYVDGIMDARHDCAIARLGYGRTWANEIPNAPWYPGRRALRGIDNPMLNDAVYKYGATSLYTTARITNINFADAVIRGAMRIENPNHTTWVAGGDSGSVVVLPDSDYIVGLNFREDALAPAPGGGSWAGLAYPITTQLEYFADPGGTVGLA